MEQVTRRLFMRSTVLFPAVGVALASGLLKPTRVIAADLSEALDTLKQFGDLDKNKEKRRKDKKARNKEDKTREASAGKDKSRSKSVPSSTASGSVKINAPAVAENGAVVPVTVNTTLSDVERIALYVENNPQPRVAEFSFRNGALPYFSTRIKVGKSTEITAVATAGGKRYSAKQTIKVTVGGCA
jgi:sulfur-oxidizing protein SoxY